jgi:O-antigen ligase
VPALASTIAVAARPYPAGHTGASANIVIRALLYLAVASFPFEMPSLQLRWQAPQVTSSLFLAGTLLQPFVCYRRIPAPTWGFAAFLYVYLLSAVLHEPVETLGTIQYFILIAQGVTLFWAATNLMRDERVARGVLWAMAFGALVWALLPMLGLGRTSLTVWTGGERVTAFGQNANRAAVLISAGLLALYGLTHGRPGASWRTSILAWPFLAVMALALLDTGSRGGLLSLSSGLLVCVMFGRATTRGGRARALIFGVVAFLALGIMAARTEVMRHRLQATAETHTLAGREDLYPALWDMFLERPVIGWGPVNNQYEVAVRAPGMDKIRRDAHNLGLELLTTTGIVGGIPFLLALGLCVITGWRARHGSHGALPLALLATFLVANMSGNHLAFKPFWLALGFAVAAAPNAQRRPVGAHA